MEPFTLLILVAFILLALYYFLTWNYNFWQKQGIPCASGIIPLMGNMGSVIFLKQSFNSLCEKYYKQNEKVSMFGFYQLTTPTLLIRDPELIKNILQTNFINFPDNQFQVACEKRDSLISVNPFFSKMNKHWRDSRAPLSNAFSSKKLKALFVLVKDVASRMEEYITKKIHQQNGQAELEFKQLFNLYTGEISAAGVGIKGNNFEDDSKTTKNEWSYKKMLEEVFNTPFFAGGLLQVIFVNIPCLGRIFNIQMTPKGVDSFFRSTVKKILAQREIEKKNYNDFLQIINDYVQANPSSIDEETLVASHMLSYTAEIYETSAITLSFTAFQLAVYPEIQEKVRQELRVILKKYNGKLEYDGLKEMTYFDQVLNESMRQNHVVGTMVKICSKETELIGSDGLSCRIKPGNLAVISTYGLQMDPNYWPNPEKFDPDRFSDGQKAGRHKFTFLPFGEGPRICVGMRMAIMMIKVAIATILKDYSLQVSPKTPLPLVRNEARFLSAYHKGLWVILKPVKSCALSFLTIQKMIKPIQIEFATLVFKFIPSKMDLIFLLVLIIIILISLYYYLTWNYDYWQKQGIPYDENIIPGFGNISSIIFLRQNLASLCEKYYKKYKNISMFGFYQLTTPTLLVRDPELVKNILLTNFTNFADNQLELGSKKKDELLQYNPFFSKQKTWKDNRVAISNAFSSKKLKLMFTFIQDVTLNLEKYLKRIVKKEHEIELKNFFNLYTGELATTGIGVQGHNFQDDQFSNDKWLTKNALEGIFAAPAFNGGLIQVIFNHMPKLAKLMNIGVITKSVDDYYRHVVRNILAYRKRENVTSNDFLQIISDYIKTHASHSNEEAAIASYSLSFTVEVYETTAMTLSFTVFQIAANSHVQEKARNEIEMILKKHNGELNYEIVKEFTYLEQIINESMRMNHVMGILMKICTNQTKLIGSDGLSCTIKPGQAVVISTFGLQMDENYWPEPEKFDPERFNDEQKGERHKFAFLPFGEGPRICVGMRMAIITMKLAIITILRNFSLELSSKSPFPLVRDESKFLSAYEKGLWVNMKPLSQTF
ncbi:uncharacterized protein LOC127280771 [Leptopilina boulardi]|uniref:uncharacterized protein LOC127280771 n=1 Tax=Leptopilina boulardi TaxID=63433 RepID=UPI0021F636FC|nr:uncharacterized protein LOC127280771 [Leptopilina boulardi]